MRFKSKIDESILVAEVTPDQDHMFNRDLETGLSVIWNTGKKAQFMIDNELVVINKNCIIFLTEYYKIDGFKFDRMNVIQFNRQFYCVESNDELGCRGLLFFGESHVPKIVIPKNVLKQFAGLWKVLMQEIDKQEGYKLEMLKSLLQQFLILAVRAYKKQNFNLPTDNVNVGLIREFNYLVEKNYKEYSKVADYAMMLHKSPKTISNIFRKYIDKTPLQLINERRMLEAKRMLQHTDATIQEISVELNFNDITAFSHFFSSRAEKSPSLFRQELLQNR